MLGCIAKCVECQHNTVKILQFQLWIETLRWNYTLNLTTTYVPSFSSYFFFTFLLFVHLFAPFTSNSSHIICRYFGMVLKLYDSSLTWDFKPFDWNDKRSCPSQFVNVLQELNGKDVMQAHPVARSTIFLWCIPAFFQAMTKSN